MLGELTSKKTYGAFSELSAYKFLGDGGVDFKAQVEMSKADVLNPNGSTLDGQMKLAGGKLAGFDAKGFGFIPHKIMVLKKRLDSELAGKSVLIEGGWNVSIDTMQDLLDYTGFRALLEELQASAIVKRGPREIRVQATHFSDPLGLAFENREYPLRFASQYTRNLPFVLIFVIHP